MAITTKKTDSLTAVTSVKKAADNTPRVKVFIPERESASDVAIDPYEHVTIKGVTTLVRRGEWVDVPVPVFLQLRNRYPKL